MRTVKLALLLSAAWLTHASASAGELTLFSDSGLQGRQVTVRDQVRDLTQLDFNDRAGSMVIRSGRWEVCVHADFRDCSVYETGQYTRLDRLSNNISSVREIGGANTGGNYGGNYGGNAGGKRNEAVVLFSNTNFGGREMAVQSEIGDLDRTGFNDQAASIVIRSGQWEFCEHRDFGGQCRVYGPGEYRSLDRGLSRNISSIRMVGRDSRGRGGRDNGRRDGVELFVSPGFSGERIAVRDEVRNLDQRNFNDRAGSLIVAGGTWEFCEHADFGGRCLTYGPGRYDRLGRLQYQISSLRRLR
jgi:hypothetical protein